MIYLKIILTIIIIIDLSLTLIKNINDQLMVYILNHWHMLPSFTLVLLISIMILLGVED